MSCLFDDGYIECSKVIKCNVVYVMMLLVDCIRILNVDLCYSLWTVLEF